MKRRTFLAASSASLALAACGGEPAAPEYGPDPNLPAPQRGLLPSMVIPRPTGWGDARPAVPEGYSIAPIASGFGICRQTLMLPNGDILVTEGTGGGAPALRPKDIIASFIKGLGKSSVPGGNRLTLLRDADGDGSYEVRSVFAEDLNAPYGLALIGEALYVANQDAVVRFDYRPGQIEASAPPFW